MPFPSEALSGGAGGVVDGSLLQTQERPGRLRSTAPGRPPSAASQHRPLEAVIATNAASPVDRSHVRAGQRPGRGLDIMKGRPPNFLRSLVTKPL